MSALRCAFCSRPLADVWHLVTNERDALCDECVFEGCSMLKDSSRLYARRLLLEHARAGEGVDPALLDPLIAALPAPPERVCVTQQRPTCVLCGGWTPGWQGIATQGATVCGSCLVQSATCIPMESSLRLQVVLLTFDDNAPNAETGPVLSALLSLARGTDELRDFHDRAHRAKHTPLCLAAIERIPAHERTEDVTQWLALHHAELGDPRRALAIHRGLRATLPSQGTHQRSLWLMNEVWMALDAGETSPDDLRHWEAQLADARALLEQGTEHDRLARLPFIWELLASIRLADGRASEAEAALDAADAIAPTSAERWELRGRALAARGQNDAAVLAWTRALEQAHPDRRLATRVRELISDAPFAAPAVPQ